ncbi:hypothetical protein FB45DRAFT_916587 [Roridomyces roridus]|uniref:LCCL domain-containing protein n=1 Tax=Roridomyces roridus TaxID=1738132 RepID=A0AAD7BUF7_9AGAR|nr:hypothetical protein FB45DRAFT_916587 [Roridomyces roridus]
MAVPAEFTIKDITGKFVMNKGLSGDTEKLLTLQGVPWLKRKAISYGTITLFIKHFKNDEGVEVINIEQTLTGGFPGTTELRTLDWEQRHNEDHVFGAVIGQSRRVPVSELDIEHLKKDWTADTVEHGLIQSLVSSDKEKNSNIWTANQTWGIQEINGERRYVRHVKFNAPNDDIEILLVYDYLGPL